MNLKDFEQQLGAEPRSQAADFLAAKNSSVQHAAAARDALAFEDKLEQALNVPVEDDLADQILARVLPASDIGRESTAAHTGTSRQPWLRWTAMAASVALIFTLGIQFGRNQPDPNQPAPNQLAELSPLQSTFAEHVTHETFALALTEAIAPAKVQAAFAAYGVQWQPVSGNKVTYMSKCDMGDKVGLHLVMVNQAGERTTLMYLPDEPATPTDFAAVGTPARMITTAGGGAAALFAHDDQDLSSIPGRWLL